MKLKLRVQKLLVILLGIKSKLQKFVTTLHQFDYQDWVLEKIKHKGRSAVFWIGSKIVVLCNLIVIFVVLVYRLVSRYKISFIKPLTGEDIVIMFLVCGAIVFCFIIVWIYFITSFTFNTFKSTSLPLTVRLTKWCIVLALCILIIIGLLIKDAFILEPTICTFWEIKITKVYWSDTQLLELGKRYIVQKVLTTKGLNSSDILYLITRCNWDLLQIISESDHDLSRLYTKIDRSIQQGLLVVEKEHFNSMTYKLVTGSFISVGCLGSIIMLVVLIVQIVQVVSS